MPGLMFHHFHGGMHPEGQGSISGVEFSKIITAIGRDKILDAPDYFSLALAGKTKPGTYCMTFDDGLRCQFDIARPVLDHFKIKAFWFVYTSPLEGVVERLELYRYFRTVAFPNVEDFYRVFDDALAASPYSSESAAALRKFNPATYLPEFDFYTYGDRKFRFLRDKALGPVKFFEVMDAMVKSRLLSIDGLRDLLWMSADNVRLLSSQGHAIGLHSHTHPTELMMLPADQQHAEYQKNFDVLTKLTGTPINSMSHPNCSYNTGTLAILDDLGIKIGFRSNMAMLDRGPMEHPREDSAHLRKLVKN